MTSLTYDFVIAGSGFSGSLLARILCRAGYSVCVLDRAKHPRFSLGESSTPLADFLLESIAERYDFPELSAMARYGSWKEQLPYLTCGKKRGFSYIQHKEHERFSDDAAHTTSALVAASVNDSLSDTHWYRSEVDHWLARLANEEGVELLEEFELVSLERETQHWNIKGVRNSESQTVRARFLIDGTPGAQIATKVNAIVDESERLKTRTQASFAHFKQVGSVVDGESDKTLSWPFHADDAAQHHVLKEGWVWILRFDSGIASVGWVRPFSESVSQDQSQIQEDWAQLLNRYPTLLEMFKGAEFAYPFQEIKHIHRISRLCKVSQADALAVLPNAVGIVDPLHSTGIAHSLNGIVRLANLLIDNSNNNQALDLVHSSFYQELLWIDELVAICYLAQRDSFELFLGACSLYFLAAVHSERQLANGTQYHDGTQLRSGFLLHQDRKLRQVASQFRSELLRLLGCPSEERVHQRKRLIDWLRISVEPWNDIGLLDPSGANRVNRSATKC